MWRGERERKKKSKMENKAWLKLKFLFVCLFSVCFVRYIFETKKRLKKNLKQEQPSCLDQRSV